MKDEGRRMKDEWKTMPLGEFAESVDYGVTASAAEQPIGPKFLRITDIQDGAVDWESVPWCECDTRSASDARLKAGDIVFARTGATTGKSFLIRECPTDAVFASYLIRVRVGAAAEPGFVSHFFQTENYWAQVAKGARGVAQPGVNATTLKALVIPLPPLAEQRRIAEVLDRAEALRAKRRAALAQLDFLTQSLFLDLFGDPVRNERNWPTAKVSELCELVRGSSPRPQGDPQFFGGPVPRLMVADITRDGWLVTPAIDSLTVEGAKRSRPVVAGTVVMAVSGNVGLVSRLAIDACVHDGFVAFAGLDERRCQPGFLLALLHFSKALHDKHKAGAIFINLTTTDIKAMPLPLPPSPLQREFARRVTAVEALKTAQRASLAELDALFATLQHRAFRGEL